MTKAHQSIKNLLYSFFLSSHFLTNIKKHVPGENFQKPEFRRKQEKSHACTRKE